MNLNEEPKSRAVQEMEAMYLARGRDSKGIFIVYVISMILTGVIWLAMHFGPEALVWLRRIVGLITARIIVGMVTIGAGLAAHWFKKVSQRWYGIVEALFGAAGAFNITLQLQPGQSMLPQWASLVGCAYVIARGLNNISDAKAQAAGTTALPPSSMPFSTLGSLR